MTNVIGWTFYTLAAGVWQAQTKSARAFESLQLQGTPSLGTVVTQFNRLWAAARDATVGGRSLPFGPVGAFYESVPFVNGVQLSLPHNLGTTRVRALHWPTAGAAQPGTQALSADGGSIIFTPNVTHTVDVVMVVLP